VNDLQHSGRSSPIQHDGLEPKADLTSLAVKERGDTGKEQGFVFGALAANQRFELSALLFGQGQSDDFSTAHLPPRATPYF
jgi:hypothetical protein